MGLNNISWKQQTTCHQVRSKAETQSNSVTVVGVSKTSAKAGHGFQASQFKEDRDHLVTILSDPTAQRARKQEIKGKIGGNFI